MMSGSKPANFGDDGREAAEPPETAEAPSVLSEPGAEADIAEPEPFTELANLHAENASLKDRLLRTLADMENMRRRTDKEIADQRIYAATNFARDMLGLADNLRRAIESLGPEVRETADPALKGFIEGVEVTERDFLSRLARHGVKKIEPSGQKFDPNKEEALFEVPDESVPAGTVVQVVEDGYMIGERVLRPAKVGVSKSGPKG
jgi:molecular chaperone GrpE